jgi:predicted GIY-YIG superfamily endonuclease
MTRSEVRVPDRPLMYATYVIKNLQNKKYTGSTSNIKNRLEIHNDTFPEKAKFHNTTYKKGLWKIIFSKDFRTRLEALKFEKFFLGD